MKFTRNPIYRNKIKGTIMVTINIKYKGSLRNQMTHQPSGQVVTTDAPIDNKGKGEAFSPTDLLASSLGACMVTIMGIKADSLGISIDDTSIVVTKHMSDDLPRRVAQVDINIQIPHRLSDKHMGSLRRAAVTCPVAQSIHPDLKVVLDISCE